MQDDCITIALELPEERVIVQEERGEEIKVEVGVSGQERPLSKWKKGLWRPRGDSRQHDRLPPSPRDP